MSVCSFDSLASHASFASNTSYTSQRDSHHTRPTRLKKPLHVAAVPQAEATVVWASDLGGRWEELRRQKLREDIFNAISTIDKYHSFQELLHLNRELLLEEGLSVNEFDALDKDIEWWVIRLESSKLDLENRLISQSTYLTET